MNGLIFWAAQNTVMALVLAIVVYGLTRAWRYPPAAHVLWLLVLLKLVTPPLVAIDWHSMAPSDIATTASGLTSFDSATSAGSQDSVSQFLLDGALVDDPPVSTLPVAPTAIAEKSTVSAETAKWWHIAQPVIILLWLGGAAICGLLAVARIMRFERLLQDTLPAPRSSEQLTAEIAARLGGIGRAHV